MQKFEEMSNIFGLEDKRRNQLSEILDEEVRERDQHKCVVCDSEININVHYKIPRELRGEEHVDNLVTLCTSCHEAIKTVDKNMHIINVWKMLLKRRHWFKRG
ncbi:HNH endonuclease [Lysinibacillus fusiformis]|uniref:HNH endonuclease n=1 Tax=Lysinibacillus fusiformis TaxID=28031 RepID=UPI001880161D|nr:HNH endonuclease [Lysinibacillus fusiformis]MBD8522739.1 HNH endonuclease [Lysinibacillus fusiformis]